MQINRRSFIKGLIAVSALPLALSALPEADLKPTAEIWKKIEEDPTVFFVRNGYTLDLEDYIPPATRGEAFDFGEYELGSMTGLLDSATQFQPVMWELQRQYADFWSSLSENDEESEQEWPEEAEEETIEQWLDQLSASETDELNSALQAWADSEPDLVNEEDEYFSIPASGQNYAFEFFQDYTDQDLLDELGITIVEGDRPGSTYFAAELRTPIEQANEKAIAAGIPIRFKAV